MNNNNLLSIVQLSKSNSQLLPYLSEITAADKTLLQKTMEYFRQNSKNYDDSWGYVIQSTRYGGFKWYDPYSKSLIFFGRKSENDPTLVVPTFFAEAEYLAYIVSRVQNALKAPKTILKNINHEDVSVFSNFGFRTYSENEKWSEEARFDDQTFPQLVLDLKSLRFPNGKIYQNLRTVLNKKLNFQIRKYTDSDMQDVFNIFDMIDRRTQSAEQVTPGPYFVSHAMYPNADVNKYVILDKETNKIVGFTATSEISRTNIAFVAGLFQPGAKNASVWGIYNTLMAAYEDGYQLANLGGCETKGTHNFMRRTFRPVEQLGKTHLIYDNHS